MILGIPGTRTTILKEQPEIGSAELEVTAGAIYELTGVRGVNLYCSLEFLRASEILPEGRRSLGLLQDAGDSRGTQFSSRLILS